MREIKFRAWDKDKQEWFFINYSLDEIASLGINTKDLQWVQYIGLKDKNGKEIYEGDIVISWKHNGVGKLTHPDTATKKVVTWSNHNNGTGFNIAVRTRSVNEAPLMKWEVIGNIYENPELLNA